MGEEQGGKGDGGEKKKMADAGEDGKKARGTEKRKGKECEKKKDDGPITVVLKVDMHCEGCARKMKHSVKGFEGVEAVAADCANGKLTVVGTMDPWKVRDRVESKTRKTVVLVSPTNVPKEIAVKDEKKAEKKSAEDKKPEEPAASTVVLKIRLHCEGCIQRIRRTISKIKGVEAVFVDRKEESVTVKGTMDVKPLPDYLESRLKRSVAVAPPKTKDDGGGNEKVKGDKKGGGRGGDGAPGKKGGTEGVVRGAVGVEQRREDAGAKLVLPFPEPHGMEQHYAYGAFPPCAYRVEEMPPAPQLFSDENPNACSVM